MNWRERAVNATTIGELEAVVAQAKAAGVDTEEFLAWCRELWIGHGPSGQWSAIALVRKELGGVLLEERAS
jgi:hypothetical protein